MSIEELFTTQEGNPMYGFAFLLGKVLKGSGYKLTNESVLKEKKLEIETHQSTVGHVIVTQNTSLLFKILEMDEAVFEAGFDSQEEMFAFIATTPYLKSEKFTNLTKKYGKEVFYEFQDYLLENDIQTPGKNITIEHVDSCVDFDFISEMEKLDAKELRKRTAIQKFNGKTIIDLIPDIDKKYVGKLFGEFKYSFGDVESFRDFVLENPLEEIVAKFKEKFDIA